MSTETLSSQEKKFKFPIGAILMAVYSVWCIVNIFKYDIPIGVVDLILVLSTIAVAVLLFMKKTDFIIAIPFLLLAIFNISGLGSLIKELKYIYSEIYPSRIYGFGFRLLSFVCDVIPEILLCILLIVVVLLALTDKLTKSPTKFKKALTNTLYIATGIFIVLYLVNHIADFGTIYRGLYDVLYCIAILLCGLWIANPYVQETSTKENIEKNKINNEHHISLGAHICLLLFTFGIWQYVWIYKRTKFTNLVKDEEERNPTTKLLLCLFVPFYNIYWTYKTAKRVDKIAKERNVPSDLGTICLVLAIFIPIVPPILIQSKINEAITNNNANTNSDSRINDADVLVKYKALLDQGVITQDDYDAKKKELLGL